MKTARPVCRILFSSLAAASLPVWAETAPATPSVAMAQVFFGLVLVVGTIFALAWLSRRLGGALPGNGKSMKILAVLPLGTKEKIVLVEVGGQQLMLGVTPGQINTLQVFAEPVVNTSQSQVQASQPAITRSAVPFPGKNLAARSAGEFSKKLQEFLNQGNKS
jgi:flagellar protein FliO/FliZ